MSNFGMFKGTSKITCGSEITNSTLSNNTITNSSIDMNNGVITNAGTPVNSSDVVNKAYVDNIAAPVGNFTVVVTLSGTTASTVSSAVTGAFVLTVKNVVADGPCATFTVSKNHQSRYPSLTRTSSSAGMTTFERLMLTWDPGQSLKIYKTDTNYDGVYTIKLIDNS